MKFIVRLRTIIALLLIAVIAGAGVYYMEKFDFHIFTRNKTSSSEIILTHINEIYNISTVEYVYKTVFPFDFYDEDTDWYSLLNKRDKGKPLTEKEKRNTKLYDLCRDTGIPLSRSNYKFIVVTSLVKAGVSSVNLIGKDDIKIEGNSITIHLPKPEITEFIIEDNDSSSYSYPDIPVDPLHWKRITAFIRPEIEKRILAEGILTEADKRLKEFLSSLLYENGFEQVVFTRE